MFETKKEQRELQDLCQRLVEQCAEIAASQLEQRSLLSRQLTVRPGVQVDPRRADDDDAARTAAQAASESGALAYMHSMKATPNR